ncbi:hypothetical protein AMTRI_Chr04g247710 [Amborella trichopoda]
MPYTPQQNGVAERQNRTLMDMVRSVMGLAKLSLDFWGEVVLTANYIFNRTPTKVVPLTPHEIFTDRAPSLNHLRL